MALFTIAYDLIKYKDYPTLWKALQENGAHRFQDSLWLMTADSTSKDMVEWLKQYIDQDDQVFVAEIEPEKFWWNKAKAGTNNWVKKLKESL